MPPCFSVITFKAKEEDKFEQVLLESDELKTNSAAATRVYSSPKGIPFSSTKHNLSASGSTTMPTSYFPFLISSHIHIMFSGIGSGL